MIKTLAVSFAVLVASTSAAQDPGVALPRPTRPHVVGTVTFEIEDGTRRCAYSPHPGDLRRVLVRIWYPATAPDEPTAAPYAPLAPAYRHVATNSVLRAPFAKDVDRAPLLLISPGRGVEPFAYGAIAESLASHGYVVASVGMPGIGFVRYRDGFVIRPDPAFRPPRGLMSGPYEKVDAFFEPPVAIGLRDLDLAYARLRELNENDPSGRFTNRIDGDRIGIFGHSLGGRIAGAFAEKRNAVKAYASMEGIAPRRARLAGLGMPVAMLCSSGTLPYAMKNYQTLIDGRRNVVFMVELRKFGHNSVTDLPLLSPKDFAYEIDPAAGLATTTTLLRTFFDASLERSKVPFPDACRALENVLISEHPPTGK